MKPIVGITMGDPTGVGPELLLKTMSSRVLDKSQRYVVFGDFSYLRKVHGYFSRKGFRYPFHFFPFPPESLPTLRNLRNNSETIPVIDSRILTDSPLVFGQEKKWAGWASGVFIQQAVHAALNGWIQALVTLPINKESFRLGGWGKKYVDHTQMLADLTKSPAVALMLVSGPMRAVHVTQHVPLKSVPSLITRSRVSKTIELAAQGLKKLGIRSPKIAVCGLNPHAGDGGILGREEINVIGPVVKKFKRRGWAVEGPLSADALWPLVKNGKFDAGVAMYHDQGQIPVKLLNQGVVNITLGLPFVRTSVGHGTAFDIAGNGRAHPKSFLSALETAITMLKRF